MLSNIIHKDQILRKSLFQIVDRAEKTINETNYLIKQKSILELKIANLQGK